jgi:Zn-dependent protease with chaperone function/uncharacterized tellurite resistance protein B-like protein
MNFFEHQEKAQRKTSLLVVYFGLALVLLTALLYFLLALIFFRPKDLPETLGWLWNPTLFWWVLLGNVAVIVLGSLFKTLELSGGGSVVATALGGQQVNSATNDRDVRQLLNIVEEMAIASGTPVPDVYVMRGEHGINAFAAGYSSRDAVIGVTEGAMRLLSRDELQGVIAHEFSHILNGDMRLNIRLIGLVPGILCLALVGYVLLRTMHFSGSRRSSGGKGTNPLPLIGLILIVLGSIGAFFGSLIKAAVSRQREFLADASAVQFTRNPSGLAGALKKIGGLAEGSRLTTPNAAEASHLFFGNGLRKSWFGSMATHPPLIERIRAIEPSFDGRLPRLGSLEQKHGRTTAPRRSSSPPKLPLPISQMSEGSSSPHGSTLSEQRFQQAFEPPTASHLNYAVQLKESLPKDILSAAAQPLDAVALIYGLTLAQDPNQRREQLKGVSPPIDPRILDELARLARSLNSVRPEHRLPLVQLTLPALRQLSPQQFERFEQTLQSIVQSDRQIDLFEYALLKVVSRYLETSFRPVKKPTTQYYALRALLPDCGIILSALAHAGHPHTDDAISDTFNQSFARLSRSDVRVRLLPKSECGLAAIDHALGRLNRISPNLKRQLLQACAHSVAADGVIQLAEAELLRAIADTLDAPLPPFLAEE